MHARNFDKEYLSTTDAMSFWVEVETAVGIRKSSSQELKILAPFGVESLFNNTITINSKRAKIENFKNRVSEKKWLEQWPNLSVID